MHLTGKDDCTIRGIFVGMVACECMTGGGLGCSMGTTESQECATMHSIKQCALNRFRYRIRRMQMGRKAMPYRACQHTTVLHHTMSLQPQVGMLHAPQMMPTWWGTHLLKRFGSCVEAGCETRQGASPKLNPKP